MTRASAGLALVLLCAACTTAHVYEASEWSLQVHRDARFDSAVMLDATHVVFSRTDGLYRPVAPDVLWGGGPRKYVRNEKRIGIYDLATRTGRIVYSRLITRLGDGNGELVVRDARGGFALVRRERTTEIGLLIDAGGWALLDLAAGKLQPLDLAAELEPRTLELAGRPTLVGDEGAVLVPGRARGAEASSWLLLQPDGAVAELGAGEVNELRAARQAPQPTAVYVAADGARLWLSLGAAEQAGLSELAFDVDALR
jgi:hypothetical protein